jgi:hypothetical protein
MTLLSTLLGPRIASSGGPAFSAYKSSAQTPTTQTYTKLLFETEEFDTNNNFASSRFTPTVAGHYQINASALWGANTYATLVIYKNGSIYKQSGGGSALSAVNISSTIYMNGTTDYVEAYIYMEVAYALLVNSQHNWFNGSLIRTA